MEVTVKKNEVLMKGEFILDNIESIKDRFTNIMDKISGDEVKLNMKNIIEIDSAGLQIILSFCKSLKKKGVSYKVNKTNDDILHILEISGLGKYLNLA